MPGPGLAAANSTTPTLYVDLDGTLVATDTLWESLCLLLRRHPSRIAALPFWAARGRAPLKARIAALVCPDVALLPYRPEVLARIDVERAAGHRVVLATASHMRIAEAVAGHLGVFDGVLATTESTNLKGPAKLEAMRAEAAGRPVAYLGDARADLTIWAGCDRAVAFAPSRALAAALARAVPSHEILPRSAPRPARPPLLHALRPHQWVKNALLFAPLLLAHQVGDVARLTAVIAGFAAFCLVASAGYLVNDMLDIEADRRHASKRNRPFAAGNLSIPAGIALLALLLATGFGIAGLFVSPAFAGMVAAYLAATLAYSFELKERLFLDVLVLAGLYTHRVLAGGVAAGVEVSSWLLAFSVFFFLSLALVKRYVELLEKAASDRAGTGRVARRAYATGDTGLVETMGITSGYLSVLVLGLYVSRDDVTRYYSNPEVLWLATPLMLYWISRIWLLARRGEITADPVLFAATDRVSYWIVLGVVSIGVAAASTGG